MFVVFQVAPILAALLITGAMSFAEAPEYSIGFFNSTPGRISEARVEWKVDGTARHEGGGVMNSGVEAVFH
jgi:hypothetical protein